MKHINEQMRDAINEARTVDFRAQFNTPNGPVDATITVDRKDADKMELFLREECGNTVLHAANPEGEPLEDF